MIPLETHSTSLLETANADIHFLPEFNILCLHWKQRFTSGIIKEVYGNLFTQMQAYQVKQLLIDTRLRGRATPEDETWMMQEFSMQLIGAFSDNIQMAFILAPGHYEELKAEAPNGSMESLSNIFCMHYFLDVPEALQWLKNGKKLS